jgi:hypothetical protein
MSRSTIETVKVEGAQLIDQVKRLVHEGNVRRVAVKQGEQTIAEFPLTVGVIGTVFAPVLAAIGVLAALLADCTIEVERDTPDTLAESINVTVVPTAQCSSNEQYVDKFAEFEQPYSEFAFYELASPAD